jgi:hypothetical protein
MVNIMISVLPDGIPVDKMEETEEGYTCPLPTQDPELNEMNRDMAIADHNYREPNTGVSFRSDQVCGSCAMYNQTEDILECIEDESGNTGYCQSLKFVCIKENTCDLWAEGGPITSDMQEDYKDNL